MAIIEVWQTLQTYSMKYKNFSKGEKKSKATEIRFYIAYLYILDYGRSFLYKEMELRIS